MIKCAAKGPVASNYRPTTCLSTLWKLFSGILAHKMWHHIYENELLDSEQKGVRPVSRGTKDQLMINKMVGLDCKTNLAVCWIDFQKSL